MTDSVSCAAPTLKLKDKPVSWDRSYTIYGPGDFEGSLENYTLIPVERTGFVVIKNVITLDDFEG
ncbi:hypothetical protein KKA03_01765 [archaeon]|nr:hypothetical protein [archaeon]